MQYNSAVIVPERFLFLVIGCGGTGGNLARDLPKLLIGSRNHKLMLIDGDIIESGNLKRQPYQTQDLNKNKARILARKINTFYKVGALFYDRYLTASELDEICKKYYDYIPVFLGCVDNDQTRKLIEKSFLNQNEAVYIDGANSSFEGNVYVVYKKGPEHFGKIRSEVYTLEDDFNPGLASCEDEIAKGDTQFLITNNKIAAVMLEHVHATLSGYVYYGVTNVERFKILHY